MSEKEILSAWIDEHRSELIALLKELIAAPTENPPGNETAAATVLQAYFDRYDIPSVLHEAEPGRGNLIAEIGSGGKRLFIPGHLDVVPAGDGWTVPPFEGIIRDGYIYGRGVADNKGPTAAIALAAACIQRCFQLNGALIVAGVADEERGSALGMEYLMREGIVAADYAIVPDIAGDMRSIAVAEKGLFDVEIVSHGKQAHGSRPEQGINAIWNLIAVLEKLRQRGLPQVEHKFLSPPTLNLGQIAGGAAPNVVAGNARAVLDFRFLPGQSTKDLTQLLEDVLRETENEIKGARFELKPITTLPPTEVPEDNCLVKLLQEATADVADREAAPMGMSGATVTKQLVSRGITAVAFGVGKSDQAHMADEHISIEELMLFAKVMALAAVRLLGVK